MSVEIKLKRPDRTHVPGDIMKGVVVVTSPKGTLSHQGLTVTVFGQCNVQLQPAKTMGVSDIVLTPLRPITLIKSITTIVPPNAEKFPEGRTEVPFAIPFAMPSESHLRPHVEEFDFLESYHGVLISTVYTITAELARGTFSKNISKEVEFFVQVPKLVERGSQAAAALLRPVEINLSKDDIKTVKLNRGSAMLPSFVISGHLNSAICNLNGSGTLDGELTVVECDAILRSIELQLVRVESLITGESAPAREATEIQNIQLVDGDLPRGIAVPIYMVFPRLFTCPSMKTRQYGIEFEINLVVQFMGGLQITENIPIKLYRAVQ
eukprot:ANDGO_03492.mRNA.1 Down syndrome critical region protein 3 homolog